jgi:iron(III) transport system substrate-binding protein
MQGIVKIFTSLFIVVIILFVLLSSSCRKSPGENQRQVVLYCSVDQAIAEPIIAEFEKQSRIKVLARFDTEASKTVGLVQKIRAEAASPVADVFWSGEIFHTIRLAREGLLSAYENGNIKNRPALFLDPLARWHGFGLRARVIAYNTQRVSTEQAPRNLEDCLDSKWKGRLVMASPEFGTTGGDVASWFAHYGPARTGEILHALKLNDMRLVSGNSTAVRMIATGQADICFTDTDDVYAAQRNGWPVAMNYLNHGGDGPLAIPNTAAVIAGAPHPDVAKELMEYLLSEQLELMLVQSDSHNCPIRPALVQQYPSYAIPKPLDIDYDKVADLLPEAIKTAREILQ